MKAQILFLMALTAPALTFAKSIDCSKASDGTVMIQVSNARLSSQQAVQEAFACFSQSNPLVQSQVQSAKDLGALEIGTLGYVCSVNNVESVQISSDHIQNPAKGEAKTETVLLVSQAVECNGVGAGQAQTNLRSAQFLVKVTEVMSGILTGKISQDLIVKLESSLDLKN